MTASHSHLDCAKTDQMQPGGRTEVKLGLEIKGFVSYDIAPVAVKGE